MFSKQVLDHFKNPRNAGELSESTAVAEVSNPVCGDILRLAVRLEGGRITEARFKAQGCVTAMAASSMLTELITGLSREEAAEVTSEQVASALGGLPPATYHGAQLACDGLAAVLKLTA
jgi:nitrogen fixation protein NifU and related proteins